MTTNKDAYDRLRSGVAAAQLGFSDSLGGGGGRRFLDLYHIYDDELDAMVAADLMKSSAQYKVLTQGLKEAKRELEDVVDDIKTLVQTTEAALKIAQIFAKIIALI